MSETYESLLASAEISESTLEDQGNQSTPQQNEAADTKSNKETNITDPKVCHDPLFQSEGIARLNTSEAKTWMMDGELSSNNPGSPGSDLLMDGVQYPLLVINDRNVEELDIINYKLYYDSFLPSITVTIKDTHQKEQKINSTQMSGLIRTAIISSVDKVYKKILMQFRIIDVSIDHNNPIIVTYNGRYEIPNFRETGVGHIYMKDFCPAKWCQWPPKVQIAANTWEFLHELSKIAELGFAATYHTKEINDRITRNIPSLKINEYIQEQISYSGVDEDSIMDAWVDLYGYIVLVNVSYVFNEQLEPEDLTIIANYGLNTTTTLLPEQKPQPVPRTLTNFPMMNTVSNMMIKKYSMSINNSAVTSGTLERSYSIILKGRDTIINMNDIQIKQPSTDGEHLEDYNTNVSMPIPRFDFNDPSYTGLPGYNTQLQEKIRSAWFMNKRQSTLKVELSQVNLGLQRGTLVNVVIYENDPVNKKIMLEQSSNVYGNEGDVHNDDLSVSDDWVRGSTIINDAGWIMNIKLSGMYYIDSMTFEFSQGTGDIVQTLYLIKKGRTTGYNNRHAGPHIPDVVERETLPQDSSDEAEDADVNKNNL